MAGPRARCPAGNLPAEVEELIGRRHEAADVKRLLSSTRIVTLTGVGGVGKTRLALRVAAEVTRAFPDGVWLVELAELTYPEALPETVGAALGMRDRSTAPTVARLIDYLKHRRLLLVLDNCEHLADACAILVSKLLKAAPGVRVLATSRELLKIAGEHVFEVPPLSVPAEDVPLEPGDLLRYEAIRLFAARAASVVPDFEITAANGRTVAQICRLLDGIPLAIELAGILRRSMSLDQIVARLGDRFRLLTGGSRTALPRQRTLRALIDWSYDLCSPAERTLWQRLSVFTGGFDLAAAERVASGGGIAIEEVAALITGLVDKSIVSREKNGKRYWLLEIVRQYGWDRLTSSPEGPLPVRIRHRDHYRRLATESEKDFFSPRQMEWGARLSAEHANLRSALDFCLSEPGHADAGLEIAASLWHYWVFVSGRVGEGRRWLERALTLERRPGPSRNKGLCVCGWLALLQGDAADGLAMLEECRGMAERIGDEGALTQVAQLFALAEMLQSEPDPARAVSLFEQVLTRHRARNDLNGMWVTLYQMTIIETLRDPDHAGDLGEQGLALCDRYEALWSKSLLLWATAFTWWRRGCHHRTITLLREALRIKRLSYDPWGSTYCLATMAWLAEARGEHPRAARLFGAVHALDQLMGASPTHLSWLAGFHECSETRTRQAMDSKAFAAAFERGAGMSLSEAIAFALEEKTAAVPAKPSQPARGDLPVLTPREREVAELVAQGLSNKDIAAKLVIAQRTAEGHVERILTKLGFTSRAQIAAVVTAARDAPGPDDGIMSGHPVDQP
ncbi:LuxR C-terminal-related transcriptional regulator [Actinoallomurus spadix]|uniref:LuxR family transcriptional regulator n=1 Tax=Actinoallomurus spadix TaxID=79912 RepID=A0ABN0WYB6_9ACTN|nr:LuxR C-terminal-related transcriptional regulator [Actinoallomurus spadix]MCO5986742.1 LuxR C-terminal-related transcriptional regulator [Actinoallomurus spadix]